MSASQLRILTICLTALAAFLSFFLGGAQQIGLDPMLALFLGAALAALNVALGMLPSLSGASGLEPGKSEKDVALDARTGKLPRGLA